MSSEESLTVEILRQIRDETAKTGAETAKLRTEVTMLRTEVTETNARLGHLEASTNSRLDFLVEGQVRLHTEVAGLRGDVVDLRGAVDQQGTRFEHFLYSEGDVIRSLRDRVGRLEAHTGLT